MVLFVIFCCKPVDVKGKEAQKKARREARKAYKDAKRANREKRQAKRGKGTRRNSDVAVNGSVNQEQEKFNKRSRTKELAYRDAGPRLNLRRKMTGPDL